MKTQDYSSKNLIRCAVALTIPVVIDRIAKGGHEDRIRHFLPEYVLRGYVGPIEPYFTPEDLKSTGKRRVYINADGCRICYITRKMLNRFKTDRKISISDKWVLMNGDIKSCGDNWIKLFSNIIAVGVFDDPGASRNHPPTRFKVLPADELIVPEAIRFVNRMNIVELTLDKYTISGVRS